MWTDQDILYALFILKANNLLYHAHVQLLIDYESDDNDLMEIVTLMYADEFDNPANRAITEEEFEGLVHPDFGKCGVVKGQLGCVYSTNIYGNITKKIKFRFVEGE